MHAYTQVFYVIKTQDFEHKFYITCTETSLQTYCAIFLLNWLKELVTLRISGKRDQR